MKLVDSNKTMNSSNTVEHGFQIESTLIPSKTVARLSSLIGVFASQAYLTHATVFAHALTPIEVYVLDPRTHFHLVAGQIGDIDVGSRVCFELDGSARNGKAPFKLRSQRSSGRINRYQIALAVPASDKATAATGGIV